jgi:nucleoside-diphosphate-sugar epimerase
MPLTTVLLTGATGFLGGATAAELLSTEHAQGALFLVRAESCAHGLARLRESLARFNVAPALLSGLKEEQVICGNLADVGSFGSDPRIAAVTHVIHCAAVTSFSNHPDIRPINVDGAFAFAQRMALNPNLVRFVHVGTAMACGPHLESPICESWDLAPPAQQLVPYTASKAEIEQRMRKELPGLPLVVARPSIVIGHSKLGCTPSTSIFWVFRLAFLLETFTCELDERIDVVPVDYCAQALVTLAFKSHLNYDLYHVSAGVERSNSFREIAAAWAAATGTSSVSERYRRVTRHEVGSLAPLLAQKLGSANRRLIVRALGLYGAFAELNYTFDNQRLLSESLPLPSSLGSYLDACIRTSEAVPLMDQMLHDLK